MELDEPTLYPVMKTKSAGVRSIKARENLTCVEG
jgi:hypothetical protein